MKILHVQKIEGLAGSEKYLLSLLPELCRRGIEVEFLAVHSEADWQNIAPILEQLNSNGVKTSHVKIVSDRSVATIRKVAAHFKANRYDIVHTHLIHADFWLALIKAIYGFNFLLVSTKHGYDEKYMNNYGLNPKHVTRNLYYYVARFSERYIDRSFSVSNGIRNLFVESGISKSDKIITIHHGFNYPLLKGSRDQNTILVPGRFIRLKGHRFIIEAMKPILKQLPETKLYFVGSGPDETTLKKAVSGAGLSQNVHFLGYQSNVTELMSRASVVVVPSTAEGFGLVILEAFSTGTPVVAFDVPACNEIIEHNKSGLLVPPFDIIGLAESIIRVFNSNELAARLTTGANNRLNTYFTLSRMVDETIGFYQSVYSDCK